MSFIEHWIWIIISPIIAYFIGSIPFSYIVAKWRTGEDLREIGNKNVGGLNVMIKSGFNWGLLAGGLDFFKGLLCIILALTLPFNNTPLAGMDTYWEITPHDLIYIFVAMAVILGHNYPIYLKFKGGRGIAALVSFLTIANPIILLIFIISTAIFLLLFRYVRPAQFLAIFIGVPIAFFFNFFPPWIILSSMDSRFILGLFILGISIAIFPKYLMSFIDMFKGKEYRIGKTGGVILIEDKDLKVND
ncbi:MAG: glycerol-3-phosphate acyltransferase [Candidatus Heimdallarchaeota archaeon]|nr:glycerol-3-phosphate acyltransferase [Candidatus Heimdallarchaeota archaeon]